MQKKQEYVFINKTLFFPEKGILVVGDLHLGFEEMLREDGVNLPINQTKQTINELKDIFNQIKKQKQKINKIIFLGDIKHFFGFNKGEIYNIYEFFREIEKHIKREDIIILRGNHDTFDIKYYNIKKYHIEEGIAFIHGDIIFPEIMDKKVNMIVMGHLHPSIVLSENKGVKKEYYKCFLLGKWKEKEVIILPSFLPFIEGAIVNEDYFDSMCIIPKKDLLKFIVYIIGDERKIYNFGILKNL